MGASILWWFTVSIFIGTRVKMGTGRDGAVIEMLGLGRNKIVVVLFRGMKLQSLS